MYYQTSQLQNLRLRSHDRIKETAKIFKPPIQLKQHSPLRIRSKERLRQQEIDS